MYRNTRPLLITGLAGLLAAAGAVGLAPSAGADTAADCRNGYVALTFDDGPNPANTATLLDTLQANGVRATLFNVGQNVVANPSLVAAEVAAGMWVANHGYTHSTMPSMTPEQMTAELADTQAAISAAGGGVPRLFRPPYGATDATLESAASALGLKTVTWDVDTQDWNGVTTEQIVQTAASLTAGQSILMHDGYATTIAAIPQIVSGLTDRGLCAGMISPDTGRAVAPDTATAPTTVPTTPATTLPIR